MDRALSEKKSWDTQTKISEIGDNHHGSDQHAVYPADVNPDSPSDGLENSISTVDEGKECSTNMSNDDTISCYTRTTFHPRLQAVLREARRRAESEFKASSASNRSISERQLSSVQKFHIARSTKNIYVKTLEKEIIEEERRQFQIIQRLFVQNEQNVLLRDRIARFERVVHNPFAFHEVKVADLNLISVPLEDSFYIGANCDPNSQIGSRDLSDSFGQTCKERDARQIIVQEHPAIQDGSGFQKFMSVIAKDHNVDLSLADVRLLASLEGSSNFDADDSVSQITVHGICVEIPKGSALPFAEKSTPPQVAKFLYGPEQRLVCIDAKKLTALGLSVLSWVLAPGDRYVRPFQNIVKKVCFRNCFVERVTGKQQTHGSSKKVVIPLGWAYQLNLSDDFLDEHGDYGDMAIRLESPVGKKRVIERVLQNAPAGNIIKKLRRRERDHGNESHSNVEHREATRVGSGYEFLYVDGDFRLWYERAPQRVWEPVAINTAAGAFGFTFSFGLSWQHPPDYQEFAKCRVASNKVRFSSLSHFIGFYMEGSPHRGIKCRMRLLQRALQEKNVFPEGYNQGFLIATTGDAQDNEREEIFRRKDCRLNCFRLRSLYEAEQDDFNQFKPQGQLSQVPYLEKGVLMEDPCDFSPSAGRTQHVYFRDVGLEASGQVYRAKCCQSLEYPGLLTVLEDLETVQKPVGTIPLRCDLG